MGGSPTAKPSADAASIAAEVALMQRAQSALAAGDSARSLEALDALSARHPDGVLREEREAARVLALCASGRVDEARALGQRFLAQTPNSVQAARVRGSCAFTPKK
jgi:outer membrane protein assembly factor BamD (BamD/ComL family)